MKLAWCRSVRDAQICLHVFRVGGAKLANLEISECGTAVQIIRADEDGFACYNRTLAPSMEVEINHVNFLNNENKKSFDFPDCKPGGSRWCTSILFVQTAEPVNKHKCVASVDLVSA